MGEVVTWLLRVLLNDFFEVLQIALICFARPAPIIRRLANSGAYHGSRVGIRSGFWQLSLESAPHPASVTARLAGFIWPGKCTGS